MVGQLGPAGVGATEQVFLEYFTAFTC